MAHFLSKRAATALAVVAAIPLLAACETVTPQTDAAGSITAENAPLVRMIAKGWQLPEAEGGILPAKVNRERNHEVRAILPPDATDTRAIEVTELSAPQKAGRLVGLNGDAVATADEEIETADIAAPLPSK